ncbi:MAG: hypothetical protein VZR11_12700 [Succinimonas sp.]|nr:hypothetical protein [Succinimonas sp.]
MKLKFISFASREDYEKALRDGGQQEWQRADADTDSARDLFEFLDSLAAADSDEKRSGEVHILVIDREGDSSDDIRDHKPLEGQNHSEIFEEILKYLAEKNSDETMREISHRAWWRGGTLLKYLVTLFYVYEFYSEVGEGDLDDDAAIDVALDSPEGVRDIYFSKEGFSADKVLRVRKYKDRNGKTITWADYLNQLFYWNI